MTTGRAGVISCKHSSSHSWTAPSSCPYRHSTLVYSSRCIPPQPTCMSKHISPHYNNRTCPTPYTPTTGPYPHPRHLNPSRLASYTLHTLPTPPYAHAHHRNPPRAASYAPHTPHPPHPTPHPPTTTTAETTFGRNNSVMGAEIPTDPHVMCMPCHELL